MSNQLPPPPPPSSFDNDEYTRETQLRKFMRRLKEEPFLPIGMGLTIAALIGASRAMRQGDHKRANVMFRRRIYAQGITVLCLVAGSQYWAKDREKRKELEKIDKDKRALEKRDRWIAELEARDAEDRAAKENLDRIRTRRKEREEAAKAKER